MKLTRSQEIIAGLDLIVHHEPNADFRAEHDEVWLGGRVKPKSYSAAEREQLRNWGFAWDEDAAGWHRFV